MRATVLFASVLSLVAIGQRSKSHNARLGVNVIAAVVLVYTITSVVGVARA